MSNRTIILGTGTSTGIPMVGCSCPICSSSDPHDKRLRTSLLMNTESGTILIDTSPDLRNQLLHWNVKTIDAAIITHDHADHLHGIDDLRPFCFGPPIKNIPIYVSTTIEKKLETRFDYIFQAKKIFSDDHPILGGGIPLLELEALDLPDDKVLKHFILGEVFYLFSLPHGHTRTTGFVHQSLAYLPDCSAVSDSIVDFLSKQSLKWLIIDCLQEAPHDTHLNVSEAFRLSTLIGAENTRFIHMNHEISHQRLTELALIHYPHRRFLPAFDNEELEY